MQNRPTNEDAHIEKRICPLSACLEVLTIWMPHVWCEPYWWRTVWIVRWETHDGIKISTLTAKQKNSLWPSTTYLWNSTIQPSLFHGTGPFDAYGDVTSFAPEYLPWIYHSIFLTQHIATHSCEVQNDHPKLRHHHETRINFGHWIPINNSGFTESTS